MTHPAFISMGVNGFWVGKFVTGYKGATSVAAAQVNANDASKVIIKPNVYSWRGITVKSIFETSYNYQRNLDSHMMKNTEWGAVAYLSHSKYGKNAEINLNNNSSYKTGYSSSPTASQLTIPGDSGDGNNFNTTYNTVIGYKASTTENISGVYDMSGGSHEYMSSYLNGKTGVSGFTVSTLSNYDSKYFDVYSSSSKESTFRYRILGDATGEMGPFKNYADGNNAAVYHSTWYNDSSGFIESDYPWFNRGGDFTYGVNAGIFDFRRFTGGAATYLSFRIVLTP